MQLGIVGLGRMGGNMARRLMKGGHQIVGYAEDPAGVEQLTPIFKTLAPGRGSIPRTPGRDGVRGTAEHGYLHCGPSGAGHFTKMIHNGIEYGLMQAYAEGLDILKNANAPALEPDQRYD